MEFPRDEIANFIRSQITGDIKEVPGINKTTEKTIRETGITTTYQLFGKYLSQKTIQCSNLELYQKFKFWLESINVNSNMAEIITLAIAEKVATMIPGFYDPAIIAQ